MTDKEYKRIQRERQMTTLGAPVFEWLKEVGARFKERGVFPLSLCDFYTDQKDIEVAGIVDLLVPYNERRISYILELKKILGVSPWEMVRDRCFIHLGLPQNEKRILKSNHITTNTLFNILDWVWKCSVDLNIPLEHIMKGEKKIVRPAHIYPLGDVLNSKGWGYRADMFLAKMCMPDGFGNGMWHIKETDLDYPLSKNTKKFLSAFFRLRGDTDKEALGRASKMLGVSPLELLYAEWGYERLREKCPKETERLEALYRKRFKAVSSYSQANYLADIIPSVAE